MPLGLALLVWSDRRPTVYAEKARPLEERGLLSAKSWGIAEDRGAERASNDADVSSIPPIIPYGEFSPVRLEGWLSKRCLPG